MMHQSEFDAANVALSRAADKRKSLINTVTRLMIFIAVANVLAITRNYSPKIALRVHLLDVMKTGASSTVANGGPHEEIF